jgi:hypothetical protein
MSFGRESISVKSEFGSMVTWMWLMRGINNPTLKGNLRFERADEVRNPKEVYFSRERGIALVVVETLRRRVADQLAVSYKKRERGWSFPFLFAAATTSYKPQRGQSPRRLLALATD